MRSVVLSVTLSFVATVSVWADEFPIYQYFYPCDSGFVNCSAFPTHRYGDFGMTGLEPIDAPAGWDRFPFAGLPDGMQPLSSNERGEVVGMAEGGNGWDTGLVYGYEDVVYCIFCMDNMGFFVDTSFADINNLGFYVFNDGFYLNIGHGKTYGRPRGQVILPSRSVPLGINDDNQILIGYRPSGNPNTTTVTGVLSPFAVPEPTAIILLATVLICFGFGIKRKLSTRVALK